VTSKVISRKLLLLGEIGVGKTSLVRRLTLDELPTDYRPTIGVDLYTFRFTSADKQQEKLVDLVVWDLDGSYGPSIFSHVYSHGASGALIIGDVKSQRTLDLMVQLGMAFEKAMPSRHFSFVLNKSDLLADPGEVELPAALQTPRHPLFWTSALNGNGVTPAFIAAGTEIVRRTT
jgi:GTPase SAR1 family protein